jgi:hypothetical protein
MAAYKLEDIAKDVRVALDQNMSSDALAEIGDVDTLALDDIINSKICEGVKRIHSYAPAHLLDGGHNFGDEIYWKEKECGWVLLPEDFMRFVVFEMDDWEQPVFFPISAGDAEYNLQSSRFKGIRGTAQRPVCVISVRPEGRVLEFYSCKSTGAKVNRAVYLPYPKVSHDGTVEICKRCYDAVIHTIAALVLSIFGDTSKVSVFNELAKSSLI